jgi:hypothetical protein
MISVRDNVGQHAMESIHSVEEQVGNMLSIEWVIKWNEMCKLAEPINDHQDAISRAGTRQAFDKIHGDHLPGLC